ncbi:MAG: alpha/beta fold hydrolase [Bacteroidetes bacterium]|jgi:esterase|nr:alpha/beta fold hydrolase [Bacteroidota bacterium]MBT3750005.1 alpha/beta fold hydrolase [Bacteroidota bacterium]MBT4399457.1 alpha/beta fold hydrolase [Bacteroidota bacterium]MBT4410003.1 alpha/beta fold hydrolase [Bacteroidota bacterium]MBT5425936.1 alpha/beta fold hydrolase [Bacteroidota bacterium]
MKLHYEKLGSGHPLIILHGLYGSGGNWLRIAELLSDICEVYMVDQRNHGKSPHSNQHSYPLLMDDLNDLINELDLNKVMLLGHSMGGKTAMYYATQYPMRISKLIVVDISPLPYEHKKNDDSANHGHRQIISALRSLDLSILNNLREIDDKLVNSLPDKRLRQFLYKNLKRQTGEKYKWIINLDGLYNNINSLLDGLLPDQLPEGGYDQFPVLFFKGQQSQYIKAADEDAIKMIFPEAEIKRIQKAGHWLHAEQPEIFINTVKHFLLNT